MVYQDLLQEIFQDIWDGIYPMHYVHISSAKWIISWAKHRIFSNANDGIIAPHSHHISKVIKGIWMKYFQDIWMKLFQESGMNIFNYFNTLR